MVIGRPWFFFGKVSVVFVLQQTSFPAFHTVFRSTIWYVGPVSLLGFIWYCLSCFPGFKRALDDVCVDLFSTYHSFRYFQYFFVQIHFIDLNDLIDFVLFNWDFVFVTFERQLHPPAKAALKDVHFEINRHHHHHNRHPLHHHLMIISSFMHIIIVLIIFIISARAARLAETVFHRQCSCSDKDGLYPSGNSCLIIIFVSIIIVFHHLHPPWLQISIVTI